MSTIGLVVGKAAAVVATQALKAGVDYASEAFAGHVGIKVLGNFVKDASSQGEKLAGRIGEIAGNFIGKAIAGHSVPTVSSNVKWIGETLKTAGNAVIDHVTKKEATAVAPKEGEVEEKKEDSNSKYLDAALQVTKAAAVMAGGVAVASGIVPIAGVGLVYAAAEALPKVVRAAFETPTSANTVNFLDDIIVKGAKELVIQSISTVIGNVVRFDQINKAYNARVGQGVKTGKLVGSYLPKCMQSAAEKVGKFVGTIDAGRFAMTDESIKKANSAADSAEQLIKGGLGLADAALSKGIEASSVSLYDKAKKVAWISAGVLGGAAMLAVAPEIAPVIAGTIFLSVADKIAGWAKGKICGVEVSETEGKKFDAEKPAQLSKPAFVLSDSAIDLSKCAAAAA